MATTEKTEMVLPSAKVMQHACKLACTDDKPILLDYWLESHTGKVIIGVREGDDKILVRSQEEYTSPIVKIFKVSEELIVITENSIYIVSSKIPSKKIT